MDATRLVLLALWTLLLGAALCTTVELVRAELGKKPRPALALGVVLLGVSGLVLQSMAA
jgi:hypothetical protein